MKRQPVEKATVQGIHLAELAGLQLSDAQVAALAAGALKPSDLIVPAADHETARPETEEESSSEEGESDEESSDDGVSDSTSQAANEAEQEKQREPEGEDDNSDGEYDSVKKGNGRKNVLGHPAAERDVADATAATGEQMSALPETAASGRDETLSPIAHDEEDEEDSSSSSSDESEPPRRKQPFLPTKGPLSSCPRGHVSDGEEADFVAGDIPMTKNEEAEPILPLGEISMDGAETMDVGAIISLVEVDGTIVIRGIPGQTPLDEGSVLSSIAQDTNVKEPIGRIHEIFGPCSIPHYTVRVEGAATHHQLIARCQTATEKLLAAEKERAEDLKHDVEEEANARRQEDGVAEPGPPQPLQEPSQKAARERKKPKPNAEEKLEALRATVKETEEALGDHKKHPFRRFKVGAPVFALKHHAKFLAQELLIKRGKGSDASNLHDEEADEEEFSDDEQERLAKQRQKTEKRRNYRAEQGMLPHEIDVINAKEDGKRRQRKSRRDAEYGGRGNRSRGFQRSQGRGRGGRGHSRGIDNGGHGWGNANDESSAHGAGMRTGADARGWGHAEYSAPAVSHPSPAQVAVMPASVPYPPPLIQGQHAGATLVLQPTGGVPGLSGAPVIQGAAYPAGYGVAYSPPQTVVYGPSQVPNPSQYLQQQQQQQHFQVLPAPLQQPQGYGPQLVLPQPAAVAPPRGGLNYANASNIAGGHVASNGSQQGMPGGVLQLSTRPPGQ